MRGFQSGDVLYTGFLLAVLLLHVHFPPTKATDSLPVLSIPEKPAEGQNVTFSVVNVTGNIRQFDWYRGMVTDGGSRIFTYFTGENKRPQRNGVRFTHREFGYPNGSLLITGLQQNDTGPYSVVILVRPKGTFKGTTVLQLADPATTAPPPTPPMTTLPAKVPSTLGWIVAGVLVGILLVGVLGAILVYRFVLQKAEPGTGDCLVATIRLARQEVTANGLSYITASVATPSPWSPPFHGVTNYPAVYPDGQAGLVNLGSQPKRRMKLDPRAIRPPAFKRDDTEPIYEVMDSPVDSPRMEGKPTHPIPEPIPPLAGTCPSLDSNYMDLLRRAESIYSEIKR